MAGYIQSGTQRGRIVRNASVDMTSKRGYLAALTDDVGEAKVALPTAANQLVQFIIEDVGLPTAHNNLGSATGNVSGGTSGVSLIPLEPGQNMRVVLSGTCSGGAWLAAANGGTATAMGSTSGWTIGVAEEDGVAGQYVLFRPLVMWRGAAAF